MPSPAQASSAIACRVSSASHIRQSFPAASCSSGMSARSRKALHSSARRSGTDPRRSSTQALQRRAASSTASAQFGMRCGGQAPSGERAKRNPSEPSRIRLTSANRSGGHSSNSSVIGPPNIACHTDSEVASCVRRPVTRPSSRIVLMNSPHGDGSQPAPSHARRQPEPASVPRRTKRASRTRPTFD